jgi:cyclic-di-GMP phosphodiesterase TipF (flagellum assembly factor)
VQGLVYIFIGLAGIAIGAAVYFGLTFTPIEAFLTVLIMVLGAVLILERTLRQRNEARIRKAVEDLSRLLSTDAQAGQVLSRRVNELTDQDAGGRLEAIEADISVLGTVVKQVAEAMADFEDEHRSGPHYGMGGGDDTKPAAPAAPAMTREPEPVIPLEMLRQAIEEDRLIYHMQPIITLPQRRTHGYDLVPRLMLEDGELADSADFLPRKGGDSLLRQMDAMACNEAVTISRRARTSGEPATLFVPMNRATLADDDATDLIVGQLDANRAIAQGLVFMIREDEWRALNGFERKAAKSIADKGVGFSLTNARSLRHDYADLAGEGFTSIRADATRFVSEPDTYTDFHSSDIAAYVKRFGVNLIMTGVVNEQQILSLLDDGIGFAQGPHVAKPGPVRPDLLVRTASVKPEQRRAGS